MTLFCDYDNVELAVERIRLTEGIEGLTEAADGSVAFGGVQIDDPAGDLTIVGWQPIRFRESACSQPRIFTGYVTARNVSRGPYITGPGRVWDCDLIDLNALLHIHVLRGASAKRPAESGSARIAWLLTTTGLAGVVFDNGLVMANAWTYDATDYRGQYADDVLRDIVSASGLNRWTFFLYWDNAAASGEEVSLFYNDLSDAVNDSTLRISNVSSDVDNSTTFAPFRDAVLERDPSDQYGGVYVTGQAISPLYRTSATTIAAMGFVRDGTYTSARLNNATTASNHANGYLGWHAEEVDKITCTVRLPAAKVNLIAAGMRVQCKFEHLPDYGSFTWLRVSRRTVRQAPDDDTQYDVALELSLKGVLQTGGGDPGDFPLPSSCVDGTAEIVSGQTFAGAPTPGGGSTADASLPSDPTVGNTVICYMPMRNSSPTWPNLPDGFTDAGPGVIAPFETTGRVCYRYVQTGDTAAIAHWGGGASGQWPDAVRLEERVGTPDVVATSTTNDVDPGYVANSDFPGAAITPGSGRLGVITGFVFMKRDQALLTAGTGYTLLTARKEGSVLEWAVVEKIITSTSGTYTPQFQSSTGQVVFDDHDYGAITVALLCANTENPPKAGQWVDGEVVTMSGSTGTTVFPFAAGSLTVWVDDIDQTAALVSSDGATGTFVLSFVPTTTEIVTVRYQGI